MVKLLYFFSKQHWPILLKNFHLSSWGFSTKGVISLVTYILDTVTWFLFVFCIILISTINNFVTVIKHKKMIIFNNVFKILQMLAYFRTWAQTSNLVYSNVILFQYILTIKWNTTRTITTAITQLIFL